MGSRIAMPVEKTIQPKRARLFATDRHRQSLGEIHTIAQHGQEVLLTITEGTSVGHHAYPQQVVTVGHVKSKSNGSIPPGLYRKRLPAGQYILAGNGIEQGQHHFSFYLPVGKISYRGSYLRLIARTDKTRQIGHQHKFLGSYCRGSELPRHHIFGMRPGTEVPTREALRHRKRKGYLAQLIGPQLRVKESSLSKIGTYLGRKFSSRFNR